jgi:hypothetical protein
VRGLARPSRRGVKMKICVTGHRPNKMYGYNIYNQKWTELKEKFKKLLVENDCD